MTADRTADVVVIGSGAVGTSVAYHLARRGKDVVVVDRGGFASGTSAATFALVWVHSKEPAEYMELSLRSARLFPSFVDELGEDVRLAQPGGMTLCMSDADLEKGHALVRRQRASPLFEGRVLDAAETHALQPGLSDEVRGSVYSPHDGHLDSIRYVTALARAARRWGVTFSLYDEVMAIERVDGRIAGVHTRRARIAAPYVVDCAGPYAGVVAGLVGVSLPMRPLRGQILVTAPMPRTLRLPMSGVRQDPVSGHVFMGFTREDVGFDTRVSSEGIRGILRGAVRKVPMLRDATLLRTFAGVRSMPKDGLPCIGAVPAVPGFFVAVSHSGVTLSPLHGRAISDLICDGRTELPIGRYDPTRVMGEVEAA
jgi:sarcosine oxidase subunit beta